MVPLFCRKADNEEINIFYLNSDRPTGLSYQREGDGLCRGDHLAILGAPLGRRQLCRHSLRGGVHREESKQVAGELI